MVNTEVNHKEPFLSRSLHVRNAWGRLVVETTLTEEYLPSAVQIPDRKQWYISQELTR